MNNSIRPFISTSCVCCGGSSINASPAILMPFISHRVFNWRPVIVDESWALNTINNGTAYALCNSLHCMHCGLLFLDIRFSSHEMKNLYINYRGADYVALRDKYEPGYAVINERLNQRSRYLIDVESFLAPYLDPATLFILDWGGGTGINTPFVLDGRPFHVYEISNELPILGGVAVSKEYIKENFYNLVVCSNVLEHIPYPLDFLVEIKSTVRKGALFYFEVPFETIMQHECVNIAEKKRYWHEHINFFSEESLTKLLCRAGFNIKIIKVMNYLTQDNHKKHYFSIVCQ